MKSKWADFCLCSSPPSPHFCVEDTTADSNDIAPLARSVHVAGNRGFVGSTAAWQTVSAEFLYPAIESARPRPREGTKSALSAPRLSFWEGQVLRAREVMPRLTLRSVVRYPLFVREGDVARMLDGLRRGGLPE